MEMRPKQTAMELKRAQREKRKARKQGGRLGSTGPSAVAAPTGTPAPANLSGSTGPSSFRPIAASRSSAGKDLRRSSSCPLPGIGFRPQQVNPSSQLPISGGGVAGASRLSSASAYSNVLLDVMNQVVADTRDGFGGAGSGGGGRLSGLRRGSAAGDLYGAGAGADGADGGDGGDEAGQWNALSGMPLDLSLVSQTLFRSSSSFKWLNSSHAAAVCDAMLVSGGCTEGDPLTASAAAPGAPDAPVAPHRRKRRRGEGRGRGEGGIDEDEDEDEDDNDDDDLDDEDGDGDGDGGGRGGRGRAGGKRGVPLGETRMVLRGAVKRALTYYSFPGNHLSSAILSRALLAARRQERRGARRLQSGEDADWEAFFEQRRGQWRRAFQSLFSMLGEGRCPFFYYKAEQHTILFLKAGAVHGEHSEAEGGESGDREGSSTAGSPSSSRASSQPQAASARRRSPMTALVSRSGRAFRRELRASDISFYHPLKEGGGGGGAGGGGGGAGSGSDSEDEDDDDDNDEDDDGEEDSGNDDGGGGEGGEGEDDAASGGAAGDGGDGEGKGASGVGGGLRVGPQTL